MENKPQNVFDRLDSIEATQSSTQVQNQQILDLLNKLSNQQPTKQNEDVRLQLQSQVSLRNFAISSKKEHVWFGTISEFNKSKSIVNVICVALIIVGILSTIFTSIAFKTYSIFSFFENIWLIFACIMFSHSVNAKKRMLDFDLMKHSNTVFVQDDDGTWMDTNKEKKRFRWFRRISYFAVFNNIIFMWEQSKVGIAITATLFELAFAGITIGLFFAYSNLFCMYGNIILYTGRIAPKTETVTLIFDVILKKITPYEECTDKMKEYL